MPKRNYPAINYQGITLSSRYDDLEELSEMIHFCEAGKIAGLNPYLKSLNYNSKSGYCHFETVLPMQKNDPIFHAIRIIASKTLSAYSLCGEFYDDETEILEFPNENLPPLTWDNVNGDFSETLN